jgi:hypothetical protein
MWSWEGGSVWAVDLETMNEETYGAAEAGAHGLDMKNVSHTNLLLSMSADVRLPEAGI